MFVTYHILSGLTQWVAPTIITPPPATGGSYSQSGTSLANSILNEWFKEKMKRNQN